MFLYKVLMSGVLITLKIYFNLNFYYFNYKKVVVLYTYSFLPFLNIK